MRDAGLRHHRGSWLLLLHNRPRLLLLQYGCRGLGGLLWRLLHDWSGLLWRLLLSRSSRPRLLLLLLHDRPGLGLLLHRGSRSRLWLLHDRPRLGLLLHRSSRSRLLLLHDRSGLLLLHGGHWPWLLLWHALEVVKVVEGASSVLLARVAWASKVVRVVAWKKLVVGLAVEVASTDEAVVAEVVAWAVAFCGCCWRDGCG